MEKIFDIAKDSEQSWGTIAQSIDGNFDKLDKAQIQTVRTYNLFNAAAIQTGKYVNSYNGKLDPVEGWSCSDYIPVKENTSYYLAGTASLTSGISWFDSDKQVISFSGGVNIYDKSHTSPPNAAFVVFNLEKNNKGSSGIIFSEGDEPREYIPYYAIPQNAIEGLDEVINSAIFLSKNKEYFKVSFEYPNINIVQGVNELKMTLNRYDGITPNYNGNPIFNLSRWIFADSQYSCDDDVAPMHIQNTTIGANHAQPCAIGTIVDHGKSNIDIGTEWVREDDGTKYYIMRIVDEDHIVFLSENKGTPQNHNFTLLKSGILKNGDDELNVSSVTNTQLWESVFNISQKLYADGEEIRSDGEYVSRVLDIVESYDVVNTDEVLNNIISRKGQSQEAEYISTPICHIENIYRILPNMSMIIIGNVVAKQNYTFLDYMFAQSARIGNQQTDIKYYIPNSLEINGYNFNIPTSVEWNSELPAFNFKEEYWANKQNPVNRVIQIREDNVGFAIGFLPIGNGNISENTSNTFEIRNNSGKVYPHPFDSGALGKTINAGDIRSAILYRCFFKANEVQGRISLYHVLFNDTTFIFADYDKKMSDHIVISDELNGLFVTVVDSQNVVLHTHIYNGGIYVSAERADGQSSYIILKVVRNND